MRQAAIWFRYYQDEGRFQKLIWFVVAAAAIAFAQWALSPGIANLWLSGFRISDGSYFGALIALSVAWAVIVSVGLYSCGWPALVTLAFVKWGLYGIYRFAMLSGMCAIYGPGACP